MLTTAHDKPIRMLHFGHLTQLTDEVDHFAPQKDSNIYKTAPYNIKSLCTKIENMFIHVMMIIL